MRTLFDAAARDEILARLDRLSPESRPRWGTFTAPRMVCHVADQLRHGVGEMEAEPVRSPLARAPLNWLVIHVVPWPKGGAKSPPEFLRRAPETWAADLSDCKRLVHAFHERGPAAAWPASPVFGRIPGTACSHAVRAPADVVSEPTRDVRRMTSPWQRSRMPG
jgi:hypothetical protein